MYCVQVQVEGHTADGVASASLLLCGSSKVATRANFNLPPDALSFLHLVILQTSLSGLCAGKACLRNRPKKTEGAVSPAKKIELCTVSLLPLDRVPCLFLEPPLGV